MAISAATPTRTPVTPSARSSENKENTPVHINRVHKTTTPEPFKLSTGNYKAKASTPQDNFKFKATPVPDFSHRPTTPGASKDQAKVTVPKPFVLSERKRPSSAATSNNDSGFKAKPYVPLKQFVLKQEPKRVTTSKTFNLHVSDRLAARTKFEEELKMKEAAAQAREEELRKQREEQEAEEIRRIRAEMKPNLEQFHKSRPSSRPVSRQSSPAPSADVNEASH
eukprot:GFYU01001410.1.p1 GENE.GFYU01001410.1~~GFYU01001410.1.p1  ORF type:complete len:224 (+),score=76.82 GFYU01001410.1:37-708(+)